MLHRAASNAYSWWWASHIRTKQSKWLEENLQDMEDKVSSMLKIIEHKGDTFSQKVEMFYKKRPELVNHVQESYRSYRALAEKYDALSKEMQSANRTIAAVFPEQVQYAMDAADYDEFSPNCSTAAPLDLDVSDLSSPNIPKVPPMPKSPAMNLQKKELQNRTFSPTKAAQPPSSGLSKEEALDEIDKIQKEILALQTEKEFMHSIVRRCTEKSSGIENQITGLQARVSGLQDEFDISNVIDDNEARSLMAATALKSCQDTLIKLEEKQEQSSKEIQVENRRVKDIINKLTITQSEVLPNRNGVKESTDEQETETENTDRQRYRELLREKLKKELEEDLNSSQTVMQVAEKIEELVDTVAGLETEVSSQDAMINVLRSETDGLQQHIKTLEEEKEILKENEEKMNIRLKELEEELSRVKSLNQNLKEKNANLEAQFAEASCNIEHLSEKLRNVKSDEGVKNEAESISDRTIKDNKETMEHEKDGVSRLSNCVNAEGSVQSQKDVMPGNNLKLQGDGNKDFSVTGINPDKQQEELGTYEEEDDQLNWRFPFATGQEDREKLLVEEYTHVVKDYKEVRKRLSDVEKKNREGFFELALQIRELKNALAERDEEIESLKKMNSLQNDKDENHDTNSTKYFDSQGGYPESIMQTDSIQDSNLSTTLNSPQRQILDPADEYEGKEELNAITTKKVSPIEEKFRSEIDGLLEENLEFWLRFSTSVHQIQKFQNSVQDLKAELTKLKDSSGESNRTQSQVSEARAIYKHLRQIQTELTLWSENYSILKEEMQGRYASLCSFQEELTKVSISALDSEEAELSKYQAAKFQGEILNMKQESNRVSDELEAGLDLISFLKDDVEKILRKLDEELGKPQRARIPLGYFLFGIKLKKQKSQKPSFFLRTLAGYQQNETKADAP